MKSMHRLIPTVYSNGLDRWPSATPLGDVGRFLEGFLGSAAQPGTATPRAELTERDDAYVFAVELPGVAEEDLELNFEEGVLTVKGEKRDERSTDEGEAAEGGVRRRTERYYGSFERRVSLPSEVDVTKIEARFSRGVLSVTLPKNVEVPSVHKIAIQAD